MQACSQHQKTKNDEDIAKIGDDNCTPASLHWHVRQRIGSIHSDTQNRQPLRHDDRTVRDKDGGRKSRLCESRSHTKNGIIIDLSVLTSKFLHKPILQHCSYLFFFNFVENLSDFLSEISFSKLYHHQQDVKLDIIVVKEWFDMIKHLYPGIDILLTDFRNETRASSLFVAAGNKEK